jgi:hypothetical protein
MTDSLSPDLQRLGAVLRDAAAADLARRPSTPRRSRRRRTVAALVAAVLVLPAAAVAGRSLISGDEVARSIPAGTLSLFGTKPSCAVVRENVEYDCTLARAPSGDVGAGRWMGTVEPTVDRAQQVNGGCRSQNAAGTHWRCYIGEEAVRQAIIARRFLGERSLGPGAG